MKVKQNNVSLECEFCGKTIHGEPIVIKVEGALLNVCPNCKQYGNVVEQKRSTTGTKSVQSPTTKRPFTRQLRNPPNRYKGNSRSESTESLVDEFGKIIRNARMKKKLTQKNLADMSGISMAQIQSFESGKMRPTDSEAKKLERELSITLFEELDLTPEFAGTHTAKKTTLGDIANIKDYRRSR